MAGLNCRGAEKEEKEFYVGNSAAGKGRTRVVKCEPLTGREQGLGSGCL